MGQDPARPWRDSEDTSGPIAPWSEVSAAAWGSWVGEMDGGERDFFLAEAPARSFSSPLFFSFWKTHNIEPSGGMLLRTLGLGREGAYNPFGNFKHNLVKLVRVRKSKLRWKAFSTSVFLPFPKPGTRGARSPRRPWAGGKARCPGGVGRGLSLRWRRARPAWHVLCCARAPAAANLVSPRPVFLRDLIAGVNYSASRFLR